MHYNFPKTKFAHTKDWVPQVEHLLSEADEVAVEFKKWKRTPIGARNSQALFAEVVDLLHSIETFGRIVPPMVIGASIEEVINKNTERGYYAIQGTVEKNLAQPDLRVKDDCTVEIDPYWTERQEVELPGGSTPSQYAIPEGTIDLQDLIEHREMNFADGNIFKATFRKGNCSHSDELRDARKVLWFAQREVERLEKQHE